MSGSSLNITDSLFNTFIYHLSKPSVKNQIKTMLIDPIIKDINERYYYHFISLVSLLIVIVILLLMILNKLT
jgi:hypothetical protein